MQQISSKESVPFNEEYTLGEQHSMGELKAAYYVSYTSADKRRYIINTTLLVIAIISVLFACMVLFFSISDWFGLRHTVGYIYPLLTAFNALAITSAFSGKRKWSNWPLIGPRSRNLRVYVYQEGLIKQIGKRSEVIKWPEIAGVTYIPFVAPRSESRVQQLKVTGVNLQLRNGHTLKINGAIDHAAALAELLQHMRSNYNSVTV